MKLTKGILVALGGLAISGSAMAQNAVEGQKTAPLQTILPNSYGKVELRHETDRYMNGDEIDHTTPNVSIRPMLGSKFFDGALNTYFVWIFEQYAENPTWKKSLLYNESFFDIYKNDYIYLTAYSYFDQANGENFRNWQIGPIVGTAPSVETTLGKVDFDIYNLFTPVYQPAGNRGKSPVKNETGIPGYSLQAEDGKIDQRDPDLYNEAGVTASFSPAAFKKFSTLVGVINFAYYQPKYAADLVDGEEVYNHDGYSVDRKTMTIWNLGYSLTDKVRLGNSFRHYTGGFYQDGLNANEYKRWENRMSVTATLF